MTDPIPARPHRHAASGLCALLLTAVACAPAPDAGPSEAAAGGPPPAEALAAAKVITPELLRGPIAELSSDAYGGRGPGSEGDVMARAYLAEQMAALGFEPAGPNGSWEQVFDIIGVNASAPETWAFRGPEGTAELARWDEFIAGSGVQSDRAAIDDAELVFIGYGIQAPEYDWDDFKDVDVTGKVVVVMNNDPDWDDALFEGNRRLYYGRWTYKYDKAAEMGAVGTIIIHTTPSAGYPFQVVQTSWTGEQFEVPAGDEPRSQVEAWTTEEAMRDVVALGGFDLDELRASARSRDFRPVPLGVRTSLELKNTVRRVQTANVLGILRGSDPVLADQAVVYSAHHDHLGIGTPNDEGDAIYNGAFDNASGVSQVLAIAKAFTQLPQRPRRSILLAFVAAEEQGLLGSAYYADHPTIPPGRLAADLNFDGGNIWGKNRDVTFVGYGKSSLDALVERFAAYQGRVVKPDQFPDRGYFYRSDQLHFARIGVPAMYLDTGTDFVDRPAEWGREQVEKWEANDYHQPSDELSESWNFDGMVDDASLGLWVGYAVAQADEMPTWNPGDEFEAARLAALAAE